jgi:hypothetical protein
MENVVIYSGYLEYFMHHWVDFMGIWKLCSPLVHFPRWYIVPRIIWQPWSKRAKIVIITLTPC